MKFKISQVSKMSGISVSGIRFYEQAGAISPLRGQNGKYRDFSLHELQLLMMCKHYRDSGFSLQESVELLNRADAKEVIEHTEAQCIKLRQEINQKKVLVEMMTAKIKGIECYQKSDPCCEVMQTPALLRIKLWQPGSKEGEYTPFPLIYEWFDRIPIVESCLLLSEESFLHGKGELDTDWGVAIEERFANQLNFLPKAKVEFIPSCESLRVVINVTENLTIMSNQLTIAKEYLAEHNLSPNGSAISRLLFNTNKNGKLARFDSLWVPIKSHL